MSINSRFDFTTVFDPSQISSIEDLTSQMNYYHRPLNNCQVKNAAILLNKKSKINGNKNYSINNYKPRINNYS
jgi:hypothetical protein